MDTDVDVNGRPVDWAIIQSAVSGVPDAWDVIVDAYAGLVWRAARRRHLDGQGAAEVSRLTWLRLTDKLGDLAPEAIGSWLERTVERECTRLLRLSATGGAARALPA